MNLFSSDINADMDRVSFEFCEQLSFSDSLCLSVCFSVCLSLCLSRLPYGTVPMAQHRSFTLPIRISALRLSRLRFSIPQCSLSLPLHADAVSAAAVSSAGTGVNDSASVAAAVLASSLNFCGSAVPIAAACIGESAFGDTSRMRAVSPCSATSRPAASCSVETRKPVVRSKILQITQVQTPDQMPATSTAIVCHNGRY